MQTVRKYHAIWDTQGKGDETPLVATQIIGNLASRDGLVTPMIFRHDMQLAKYDLPTLCVRNGVSKSTCTPQYRACYFGC